MSSSMMDKGSGGSDGMMTVMMCIDTVEAQDQADKYHADHPDSTMSKKDFSCSGPGGDEFQAITASRAPMMVSMMSGADKIGATPAFMAHADPKAMSAYRQAKAKSGN